MEKFQREHVTFALIEELLPLFTLHNNTVATHRDIPLSPNYDLYLAAEECGRLRAYVARCEKSNNALGYSIYFVGPHPQRKESVQADETLLFIHPDSRGFGPRFIDWCDDQLRADGVQLVRRNAKAKPDLNFSPMLERKGYELEELVWTKRLDKEVA